MRRSTVRTAVLVTCFVAAAGAGYVVSERLGADALQREAETQLGALMRGDVRVGASRVVLRGGLFLEGERVGVYGAEPSGRNPALFAGRVAAELDVFALITGRFRVSSLRLEDVVLRIERNADGHWSPPPVEALDARRREAMPDDLERNLDLTNAFEAVTRVLLEAPIVARRVEVVRGRISFTDATRGARDGTSEVLAVHGVAGRLTHHWLSGDSDLVLSGVLLGGGDSPIPLRFDGRGREGRRMRLALTVSGLPIALVHRHLADRDADHAPAGVLSGELSYDTRSPEHGTLALHCTVEDFAASLRFGDAPIALEHPLLAVDVRLDLHPRRVRLDALRVDAGSLSLSVAAGIERPLRASSRMRVEAQLKGVDLATVRAMARSVPGEDGTNLQGLLERVEDARFERVGALGITRLGEWRRLYRGELDHLPAGFILSGDLAGVRLDTEGGGRLRELGGSLELSGDRVGILDAHALWNGKPLPVLNARIEGVSRLFRAQAPAPSPEVPPGTLPGLDPLWQLVREAGEPTPEGTTGPATRIELDLLDHPVLRWPIRDARILVSPTDPGLRLSIEAGTWAGAPIRGNAEWRPGSEDTLTIDLDVAAPEAGAARDVGPRRSVREWAAGRFRVAGPVGERLPLRGASGRFTLVGDRLALDDLRADVAPTGRLSAAGHLDLADPESVGLELEIAIEGGDVARFGESVGLPAGAATGLLDVRGRIGGRLRPQTPLLAGISGAVEIEARGGEIRRRLELADALAQASDDYNAYAKNDVIAYEVASARVRLDQGRVATDDFQVEGPVRIYANGWIDVVDAPHEMSAVVGVFLFRRAGQIMETMPLFKVILPGSERGLVGAYYRVDGTVDAPEVESLRGMSVAEDLPDVLSAPFNVLKSLLGTRSKQPGAPASTPAANGYEE